MENEKKYYYVFWENRYGIRSWSKFSEEWEMDEYLDELQDDRNVDLVTYISEKPETYQEACSRLNNYEKKQMEWIISVASKTLNNE